MNLLPFAIVYVLIGVGGALAVLLTRKSGAGWLDAALLVLFWPLYGPFLLLAGKDPVGASDAPPGEADFVHSLRRARAGTPLAVLLPDEASAERLSTRLETAAQKRDEIEALLAQPAFSEERAAERCRELEARGDERAASAARGRLTNIRRLRRMRDQFSAELSEINELIAQLHIQAEVVRIAGADTDESDAIIGAIMDRVEGLDAVLDEPEWSTGQSASAN